MSVYVSCNISFNHHTMKCTFFLKNYSSIVNASWTDRKKAENIPLAYMLDFIAELHGISSSTNLHLGSSLVSFLFQSCSDSIVLKEKIKLLMFGKGNTALELCSCHTLGWSCCKKKAIMRMKTFLSVTLKPCSETTEKCCWFVQPHPSCSLILNRET